VPDGAPEAEQLRRSSAALAGVVSHRAGCRVSSASGETNGYVVECRSTHAPHVKVGEQIITRDWTLMEFQRGAGVPNRLWDPIAREQGLLGYETALALMAWAAADAGFAPCIEFRLRKRKLVWSWKITDEGAGEAVNFFEQHRAAQFTPADGGVA
jgi:hypothetical protein